MQVAVSDIFRRAGTARAGGLDDYHARLLPAPAVGREGVDRHRALIEPERDRPAAACFCAWTLARAHARSGDRIAIAAYLGAADTFDASIADFAEAYADQNERDHQALVDAVASGRITAERDM